MNFIVVGEGEKCEKRPKQQPFGQEEGKCDEKKGSSSSYVQYVACTVERLAQLFVPSFINCYLKTISGNCSRLHKLRIPHLYYCKETYCKFSLINMECFHSFSIVHKEWYKTI